MSSTSITRILKWLTCRSDLERDHLSDTLCDEGRPRLALHELALLALCKSHELLCFLDGDVARGASGMVAFDR